GRRAWCGCWRRGCPARATAWKRRRCRATWSCGMSCWLPCWGTSHEDAPVNVAISSGPRYKAWLGPAVLMSLVLLLELCTRAGWVNAVLVPPPSAVALRVFTVVRAGSVFEPLGRTLYLLAVAYAIGC